MDERSESESLYHRWLQVPLECCPPNHYQLLGIEEFATDEEAIAAAAKKRTAYLHQIAGGPNRKEIQKLLGEVAVAKRVLLNPDARTDYNDQLNAQDEQNARKETEPDEIQPDDNVEPEQETRAAAVSAAVNEPKKKLRNPAAKRSASKDSSADDEKKSANKAKQGSRQRRKKSPWDEYKLHAISASVLLGIVGVVWFVNKGGDGGRRAAQPVSAGPAGAGFRAPSAARSSAAKPATARKTSPNNKPARKPRSSGLVAMEIPGLNAPMEAKKSEANPGKTEAKNPKAGPRKARKAKGGNASKNAKTPKPKSASKFSLPSNWRDQLPVIEDLKADYQEQFTLRGPVENVSNADSGLMIEPGSDKQIVLLKKDTRVKVGEAVAVDIELEPRASLANNVGIGIGPARVVVQSAKRAYKILAKGVAKESIKPVSSVGADGGGKTLTIVMIYEKPGAVRWVVDTGSDVKSGEIQTQDMANGLVIHLFHDMLKTTKQKAWFSNLRYGTLK